MLNSSRTKKKPKAPSDADALLDALLLLIHWQHCGGGLQILSLRHLRHEELSKQIETFLHSLQTFDQQMQRSYMISLRHATQMLIMAVPAAC